MLISNDKNKNMKNRYKKKWQQKQWPSGLFSIIQPNWSKIQCDNNSNYDNDQQKHQQQKHQQQLKL